MQIDRHAILVGPRLRKDDQGTRPVCSGVLVHQFQLLQLTYLVTLKFSCDGLNPCALSTTVANSVCHLETYPLAPSLLKLPVVRPEFLVLPPHHDS
jgi:hypothetical protein